MSAEARLEMLTRINRAVGGEAKPFNRRPVEPSVRAVQELSSQFEEFAAEYHAYVRRTSEDQVPAVIQELLALRGSIRVVIPVDLAGSLLPAGLPVTRDEGLSTATLTSMQAVVTTCALAIAETGTVVLDHGPGQGRRALTLVPDHHLCIVRERQVVDSVPEAVAHLQASIAAGRPLTWISGPSATSDIELSRVEGVHGPRVLDILLVKDVTPTAP